MGVSFYIQYHNRVIYVAALFNIVVSNSTRVKSVGRSGHGTRDLVKLGSATASTMAKKLIMA